MMALAFPEKKGSEIEGWKGKGAPVLTNLDSTKSDEKLVEKDGVYYVQSKATPGEYYKASRVNDSSHKFQIDYDSNTVKVDSPVDVTEVEANDLPLTGLSDGQKLYNYTNEKGEAGYVIMEKSAECKLSYYSADYKETSGEVTKGSVISEGKAATEDPLKTIDKAIAIVDEARGALGATQNRLGSVINSPSTTVANLSQSRSNIEDADFATEVSNMNRANILQQAGTAVLAQANAVPQGILSLLR